ncbi:MAG TPA: hypothetical protein VJW94_14650 [Candidatus Acidoferrum sp.]|nr:hypothetical protein [Candidatus Acidoferrum sp.]
MSAEILEIKAVAANESLNHSSFAAEEESEVIKALQVEAIRLWAADQQSAADLGRALIAVREAMASQHGAFSQWWRAEGFNENRVYYCIRRAEGKIKDSSAGTELAAPESQFNFYLTKENLAVEEFAPRTAGRYVSNTIHVGPDGTTATDGYVLARVSLINPTEDTISVTVPRGFLEKETKTLSVNDQEIRFETAGGYKIVRRADVAAPPFPPYQKILDMVKNEAADGVRLSVSPKTFKQLYRFLETVCDEEEGVDLVINKTFIYAKTLTRNNQVAEFVLRRHGVPPSSEKAAEKGDKS